MASATFTEPDDTARVSDAFGDGQVLANLAAVRLALSMTMADLDVGSLSPADAARVVVECAAIERFAHAGKVLASARAAEGDVWRKGGYRSPADWMAGETKCSKGEAKSLLDTSERVADQPHLDEALRDGRLNADQATAVSDAAAADPAAESELVEQAGTDSLGGLRDTCAKRKASASGEDRSRSERLWRLRRLHTRIGRDGAHEIDGANTPEAGAIIEAALNPYRELAFRAGTAAGRRDGHAAYTADALEMLAAAAIGVTPTCLLRRPGDTPAPTDTPTATGKGRDDAGGSTVGSHATPTDAESPPGSTAEPAGRPDRRSAVASPTGPTGPGPDATSEMGDTDLAPAAGSTHEAGADPTAANQADETPRTVPGRPPSTPGPESTPSPAPDSHPIQADLFSPVTDQPPFDETSPHDPPPSPPPDPIGADPGDIDQVLGRPPDTIIPWDPVPVGGARLPGGRVKVIVRIDHTALTRGHTTAGETCDIVGLGPLPVTAVARLLATGDPFVAAVVTRGVDVASVVHLGRQPTAHQRTALQWRDQTCVIAGCPNRLCEIDHNEGWAITRDTRTGDLALLCPHHHGQKTAGWHLTGTGTNRRLTPPDDSGPRSARWETRFG